MRKEKCRNVKLEIPFENEDISEFTVNVPPLSENIVVFKAITGD